MITPQAIKDQEFQIKFRGYDVIEVRAYLELLADDYFELSEQNRMQSEEIESLMEQLESLQRDKESLAAEVKAGRENADGIQSEIEQGYRHKDLAIEELTAQVTALQSEKTSIEEMNRKNQEKISGLENQLAGGKGASIEGRVELERLRARVEMLEQQNMELKQEGIDFKTTILAAQKFADNLRETSEMEAEQLMEDARAEVEKYRAEAEAELSRLPKEIEALSLRKQTVREELRTILQSYLAGLEVFPVEDSEEKEDDLSDLFESIEIPDLDTVDPEDLERDEIG